METIVLSGAIPDTLIKSLPDCMSGIDALEIRAALAQVLASDTFVKSRRMCRLLRFLVEKQLINAIRDINEYSIGIEVFDRDPASYNTGDDPIVRVQIGRLREKLKAYYAAVGNNVNLQISIPIGHYMPVIRRPGVGVTDFKHSHMLAILPLRCISDIAAGVVFTDGLSEELSYQLFKEFGDKIVSHTFAQTNDNNDTKAFGASLQPGVSHFLEGSIRVENDFIRASFRMIDASAGCIAWSEQFDRQAIFSIVLQEEFAITVCASLERYFSGG